MKYLLLMLVVTGFCCASGSRSAEQNADPVMELKKGKDVFIQGQSFSGPIDLTGAGSTHAINNYMLRTTVTGGMTFVNCTFKGRVLASDRTAAGKNSVCRFLSNVTFIDCNFEETVSLNDCIFEGGLTLQKCHFSKPFEARGISSKGPCRITNCYFEAKAEMQNGIFHEQLSLFESVFEQEFSLQSSTCMMEMQASSVKMYTYADFSNVDFRAPALFNYADFRKRADLSNMHCARDCEFTAAALNEVRFNNTIFMGKLVSKDAKGFSGADLTGCFFLRGNNLAQAEQGH